MTQERVAGAGPNVRAESRTRPPGGATDRRMMLRHLRIGMGVTATDEERHMLSGRASAFKRDPLAQRRIRPRNHNHAIPGYALHRERVDCMRSQGHLAVRRACAGTGY